MILFIAVFIGIKNGYLGFAVAENKTAEQNNEQQQTKFKFISPYYKDNQISQNKLIEFQEFLIKIIDKNKNDLNISVYFRDLNNGPWLSINPQNIFDGASLLKVPTMIAYLKSAEVNKSILTKKINYEKSFVNDLEYDPIFDQTLKVGQTYTIDDLIKIMIKKSDNTALKLLDLASVDETINLQPSIKETHKTLGLLGSEENADLTSIDQFSEIYRILYNAEYLNGEMSNKALEIMSQTDYNNGLKRYLPTDLTVAHKYGIRYYKDSDAYQLHDCGIIYSSTPYILCVMTAGNNLEKQEETISNIAKTSFEIFR